MSVARNERQRRVAQVMDRLTRLGSSRRVRVVTSLGISLVATGLLVLAARTFMEGGWPLSRGNPALIGASGVLFLVAYGFKAYGWRRLFRAGEQPDPLALAAAGGGASIMGIALPGRFDEAIRIAIVRRYPGCPVGVRGLCLSLVTLGLIDSIALSPLAASAAAFPGISPAVRAGFAVLGAGGIGAAAVVLVLPRLGASARLNRFRIVQWLSPRATPWRAAASAWALVLVSWLIRAVAVLLLLITFGIGFSISLAIMFLCAGAASAALPIGPAGAATQVAAGATLLVVTGVGTTQALGFAVAAQALLILSGAAIFLAAVIWRTGVHVWSLRPAFAPR